MTKHLPLLALLLLAAPAQAGRAWCPIDQAYYDTDTGYTIRGDQVRKNPRILVDPKPPGVGDRLDIDWSQWRP